MKKLFMIPLVIVLLTGSILSGCGEPEEPVNTTTETTTTVPPAEPIELSFASPFPATETLVSATGGWLEMTKGSCDIVHAVTTYEPVGFELQKAMAYFICGGTASILRDVYAGIFDKFPEAVAEFDGAKLLGIAGAPDCWLHTSKVPIRTLDDLKGLQIAPSAGWDEPLAALGAASVSIPFTEVYMAAQKGIIDGIALPTETLIFFNLAEVTQYHTLMYVPITMCGVRGMNWDAWNSLAPDIQKIFEDSRPWYEAELDKVAESTAEAGINCAKELGHEFFELSPGDLEAWKELWAESARERAAELDAEGLPGTEVFEETQRLIEEYSK